MEHRAGTSGRAKVHRARNWRLWNAAHVTISPFEIAGAIATMKHTYTFVFQPEPEGGFTVTCPALPGLVTYGETLAEARDMARDAMEGLIELMLEKEGRVPESDAEEAIPRYIRLAHTLQDENGAKPLFELLSARIGEKV